MSARLCVGNYASCAYCFEGLNLKVYCIEELSYCLKENAFLLDRDIMSDRLVDWLRQDCGLPDLADELYTLVHKKGSLSAFVCKILEYTGFYDKVIVRDVEQTLKKGAGLNIIEKRKMRIDYLVEQKRYLTAVSEYDALITSWEEASGNGQLQAAELKASLWHNRGTALAGLMRYAEAADSFGKAYETDGSRESLKCFLAAKRMELDDQEYVAYAASLTEAPLMETSLMETSLMDASLTENALPQASQLVLELEQDVERLNSRWEEEIDYLRLMERGNLREEDERSYLEENRRVMQALKEGYRSMTS